MHLVTNVSWWGKCLHLFQQLRFLFIIMIEIDLPKFMSTRASSKIASSTILCMVDLSEKHFGEI